MVSRVKHENFNELLGYCVDGALRVLAYEYAPHGSLHDVLHGEKHIVRFSFIVMLLSFSDLSLP